MQASLRETPYSRSDIVPLQGKLGVGVRGQDYAVRNLMGGLLECWDLVIFVVGPFWEFVLWTFLSFI